MSNKSLSRKKRVKQNAELLDAMVKFFLAANLVAKELNQLTNYVKELKFPTPKLAPGGIVSEIDQFYEENKDKGVPLKFYRDGVQISGSEAIVPIKSKGATPYDNDQYMFQND